MAQIQAPVSDQLRRTLSFFEGADLGVLPGTSGVARSTGRRTHHSILVFSDTEPGTPLLQPRAIELLAGRLAVEEAWVLGVSRIAPRTFQRRQEQDKPLSATETDRVMRIARVASQAERVFGSTDKARRWLSRENRMLGAKPLDMLASDAGAHDVEAELNRIDLGDFA